MLQRQQYSVWWLKKLCISAWGAPIEFGIADEKDKEDLKNGPLPLCVMFLMPTFIGQQLFACKDLDC